MPAWLREAPQPAAPALVVDAAPAQTPVLEPLGPRADPRTFLSDDDFPRWLRELAARREEAGGLVTAAEGGNGASVEKPAAVHSGPTPWPDWPGLHPGSPGDSASAVAPHPAPPAVMPAAEAATAQQPDGAATIPETPQPDGAPVPAPTATPDGRPPAAVVAARAREERRDDRGAWETLLLALLFIGVIVAALWALVSNGVFSPGL
jgi:hypothetical protein